MTFLSLLSYIKLKENVLRTQHSEKTTFNQQSNFTSNWFAISIIYSLYYKQNIHSSHETKWEEYTTTKKDNCNFCLILIFKRRLRLQKA